MRPLSATLSQLLSAVHEENAAPGFLAEIIETDPALSLRLIRTANSPLYGLPNEVQTVGHAVAVLGIRKLKSLIVSLADSTTTAAPAPRPSDLSNQIKKKLQENPTVRPFPASVSRLLSAFQQDDANAKTFATIIECDPGLSTRLLRAANSPLCGTSHEVRTIEHAVTILGIRRLKSMVLSLVGSAMFSSGTTAAKERQVLLEHSIGCATVARTLAQSLPDISADEAFLAGIFHDIGKLFFYDVAPVEYSEVSLSAGPDLIRNEKSIFGVTHQEVGMMSASRWALAEEVKVAMGYHHEPDSSPAHAQFAATIHLANQLAKWGGIGSTANANLEISDEVIRSVGLDRSALETVLDRASVSYAETKQAWSLSNS